jgi:hypothetical protein
MDKFEITDRRAISASGKPSAIYLLEEQNLKLKLLEHDLKVAQSRQEAREKYEPRLFNFTIAWTIIVLLLVLAEAYHFNNFFLPAKVMITIVGSTTINVFGLLMIALKYIFPKE